MRVEQVALPVLRQINKRPRLAPVLDRVLQPWNPFSPTLNVDPYPAYEQLRAKGPIVWHRGLNTWLVSSFELCEAILRAPVSVDRGDLFDVVPPWSKLSPTDRGTFTGAMLLQDPPDHTRLRRLVSRAFTPRTVERIEPRIREIAEELVGKVRHDGTVDLFDAVFAPLPIYVIGELLGIPEEDWPRLKGWSDEYAKVIDPVEAFDPSEMSAALADMKQALDGWIDLRTAEPGPDLLSRLIAAEDEGGRLSRAELQSMIALLMAAGHETTSGLLGNAIVALDGRPDLRARLAAEPEVVVPAVEELIRFDSPVQNTDRIVTEPLEIGGVRIKPGQMALLAFGAANRDPQMFDRPNEIDFDRPDIRSLSFGHGIHHCLGAALARAEARIVLPLVCEAFPGHRVQRDGLVWKRSMTLRGPIALPIIRGSRTMSDAGTSLPFMTRGRYGPGMDVVVIDPPADLIAERQRLGLDTFDEVWDGEYHMVPGPSGEHQRVVVELIVAWHPLVRAAGLQLRHEFNLIPPEEPGWRDFRVPDLVICSDEVYDERGALGAAALVVEVRSPGDESLEKLPFFERLGVGEVLIIDRDTKVVRRWVHGAGGLVESPGDAEGRHALECLPVELWTEDGTLVVLADRVRTDI